MGSITSLKPVYISTKMHKFLTTGKKMMRNKAGIGFSWINVVHRMYSSRKNHILSRGWEQVKLLTIDQNQSFVGEPSLAEVLQAGSDKLPRKPLES